MDLRIGSVVGLVLVAIAGCETPAPTPMDAGSDAGPPPAIDGGRDAGMPDAGPEAPPLDLTICPGQPDGGTIRCGTLVVPVDYEDESLGTISLPVRVRPAAIPAQRIGAIAWNPGGPGATTYPSFVSASREILDRFDLVSMDWRGVGSSVPAIECDVAMDEILARTSRYDVLEPMDLERTTLLLEAWVDGCVATQDEAVLARLGSRNAARDLDRLRASLGDARLNFWGFSYGTELGATYATLFPNRVRAFVLDSVALTGPPVITTDELDALNARLEDFFDWCAAHPGTATADCSWARGRSAAELATAWDALVDELDRYPVVVGGRTVSGNTLRGAAIAFRLGGRPAFPGIGRKLAAAEDGRYDALLTPADMPEIDPDGFTSFVAIRVADDGRVGLDARGTADWMRTNFFPHAGRLGVLFTGSTFSTLLWPVEPADGPPLAGPTTAPPMLVVGVTGDLATPYANAVSLVASLDNGSTLVTYEGTAHAPSANVACLRDVVYAFFLDPRAFPATTTCTGSEP